jgi:hypothetical protein
MSLSNLHELSYPLSKDFKPPIRHFRTIVRSRQSTCSINPSSIQAPRPFEYPNKSPSLPPLVLFLRILIQPQRYTFSTTPTPPSASLHSNKPRLSRPKEQKHPFRFPRTQVFDLDRAAPRLLLFYPGHPVPLTMCLYVASRHLYCNC